ncbi:hypothetical protein M141_1713 [Bacteroides fragilis str. S38L5]|nr:hypothetical protein M101_1715 [Bacteroides fragilis str. 1007-1-F \
MRNKFKDAYNQGYRKARFFLEQVAKLYKHEDGYRRDNLLATETKEKCNDIYINGIVDALCDGL